MVLHDLSFQSLAGRLGPEPHITRQVYPVVSRKPCCAVTHLGLAVNHCHSYPVVRLAVNKGLILTGSISFGSESETPHIPVYSNDTSLPSLPSSTIPPSSYQHSFHPGLNGPIAYPLVSSSFFSPNTQNYCGPDSKSSFRFHASDIRPILGYSNNLDIKPFSGS